MADGMQCRLEGDSQTCRGSSSSSQQPADFEKGVSYTMLMGLKQDKTVDYQ